jgi:hypothetical protein
MELVLQLYEAEQYILFKLNLLSQRQEKTNGILLMPLRMLTKELPRDLFKLRFLDALLFQEVCLVDI